MAGLNDPIVRNWPIEAVLAAAGGGGRRYAREANAVQDGLVCCGPEERRRGGTVWCLDCDERHGEDDECAAYH